MLHRQYMIYCRRYNICCRIDTVQLWQFGKILGDTHCVRDSGRHQVFGKYAPSKNDLGVMLRRERCVEAVGGVQRIEAVGDCCTFLQRIYDLNFYDFPFATIGPCPSFCKTSVFYMIWCIFPAIRAGFNLRHRLFPFSQRVLFLPPFFSLLSLRSYHRFRKQRLAAVFCIFSLDNVYSLDNV